MPSFGGPRVDGLRWARLATKLTRARLLRFLTYASSSVFLTFVRADLSHGSFLIKYAESLQFPSSSSEKSDSSELVYSFMPMAFRI